MGKAYRFWLFAAALLLGWTAAAASPLTDRAQHLPAALRGDIPAEQVFSPAFLAQVPASRLAEISAQLAASYGKALKVAGVEEKSDTSGIVLVDFERATVRLQLAVSPNPPHLIEGLLITGADAKNDDVRTVFGELTVMGDVSLDVARLEDTGPISFLTQKAERPQAIGSAFKLFILAELVRAVKAGERRGDEVVPLTARSLPSGILQEWPQGSPLTLHSLATLMISRSDNTATDALLHHLGRAKVEKMLATLGVGAAAQNRPFLSTREAFALKLGDPALLAAWSAADEAGRRALLPRLAAVPDTALDPARMAGTPRAIETVEWFASPADLIRTLDWLRRSGDPHALAILAVNPGLSHERAQGFRYMGFKGGSEPGVISLNFLLHNKAGRWIALSAALNDPKAPVDEAKFVALMARLVALLREG